MYRDRNNCLNEYRTYNLILILKTRTVKYFNFYIT